MRLNLKTKIWLTVASIVLVFCAFMLFFFPAQHQKSLIRYYNEEVQNLANTVSLGVKIALTEQNFEGVQMAMDFAKSDKRLAFAAMLQRDTLWEEDKTNYKIEKTVFKTYPEEYSLDPYITSSDSIIVRGAIFNSEIMNGEILVGFTTVEIVKNINKIRLTSIVVSLFVFVLGLALGYWLARSISVPVLQLRNAALKVGAGDLAQRVDIKVKDEIGELGDAFNIMVKHLGEAEEKIQQKNRTLQEQHSIIEQKNKDITDSINYAKRIQEAILPLDKEREKLLPESFILFKPKDIVSGDFYWLTEKGGKVLIAAADCTGHGVPGAFMSMIGNSLLNEIVNDRGITNPAEVLQYLKEGVISALKQKGEKGESQDGMDIALCSFDFKENKVEYAGANNPLYLIRNNELQVTKPDRMPIGIYIGEKPHFTNHEIPIQKGDLIYIFSDGFVDQFGGPQGKKFMSKRFKELLADIHNISMQEQKEQLDKVIEEWKANEDQMDDILIIGIRI